MFDLDQQSKQYDFACSVILSNEKLATDVIRNTWKHSPFHQINQNATKLVYMYVRPTAPSMQRFEVIKHFKAEFQVAWQCKRTIDNLFSYFSSAVCTPSSRNRHRNCNLTIQHNELLTLSAPLDPVETDTTLLILLTLLTLLTLCTMLTIQY